jgi:PAT family beta-lactamase induction signal transducer AmpG
MRLPNPLTTRSGQLTAFFLLYLTEGLPQGFAATALATQMRRMNIGPAEIGAFVALAFMPWAFKWIFGPVIDVFRSRRWGHRRGWILLTQAMMAVTLIGLSPIALPGGLTLFTGVLLVHNVFAAMQDVAIDALAVNTLAEEERGLANGMMFAGQSVGQVIGGSGVMFLMSVTGFRGSFFLVAGVILLVTATVVLPMREPQALVEEGEPASLRNALQQMRAFATESFQSFMGTRAAFAGLFFMLLPGGAMALSMALGSNLAVELGMSDDEIGKLNMMSMLVSGVAVIAGGMLSDRLGRRMTVGAYLLLMTPPVLYLAWQLQLAGYVLPRAAGSPRIDDLIRHLWIASLTYSLAQGLAYGSRIALMMDVTNPRAAATQFTAYMAMGNLAMVFASSWQGISAERYGYPKTLLFDGLTGLLCILLLPMMSRLTKAASQSLCDVHASGRAKTMARALALLCLAFVPYLWIHDPKGAFTEIAETLLTLISIMSAMLIYAGTLLQLQTPPTKRWGTLVSLLLLGAYARNWLPANDVVLVSLSGVVIVAAATLFSMSRRDWAGLAPHVTDVPQQSTEEIGRLAPI